MNFCKKEFSNKPFDKNLLENALVEYLRNIVKNQQTNIFHSGDGCYILNEKVVIVEQNNRPNFK